MYLVYNKDYIHYYWMNIKYKVLLIIVTEDDKRGKFINLKEGGWIYDIR